MPLVGSGCRHKNYDPNESKGGWGMTDEDGNEISVDIYWPTEDQRDFQTAEEPD